MAKNIFLFFFVLVAIFNIAIVNAFEVNIINPPISHVSANSIDIINVSTNLGLGTNCTYNISGLIDSSFNSIDHLWTNIDISSLEDGEILINVSCSNSADALDNNYTTRTITKYTQSPDVYWKYPNDLNEFDLSTTIELSINFTSQMGFDSSNTDAFLINCDNGDNGTLIGLASYDDINSDSAPIIFGNITQNWTTPSLSSTCIITANVANGLSTFNSSEEIILNINEINYIKNVEIEFGNDNISYIGNVDSYNLTDLFVSANSSNSFYFNLTHNGICTDISNPFEFGLGVSQYDNSENLWYADPSSFICNINFSNLNQGLNELVFDIFLNDSSTTKQVNYSIYYDTTLPKINFNWIDTLGWNETSNSTYSVRLPDFTDFIANNDMFFAPNDTINISVNISDDAVLEGIIDRAYANFSGFNLGQPTTCDGLVELTFNSANQKWEADCSVGNFTSQINALNQTIVNANITFIAYDKYNNTNEFNYYNLSNSSQVCMYPDINCMPLHVPVNLHNIGAIESFDECIQFGPLTTNLNDQDDFSNINLILDIWLNLSCFYDNNELPNTFERMMLIDFASVDFGTPASPYKLMNLIDAFDFEFSSNGNFGDSYIYVNSTAFAELDTDTKIEIFHLPFTNEPVIIPENPSNLNSTSITWVTNGRDDFYLGSPITGNLTFEVFGFSKYTITDNIDPIITINNPTADTITNNNIMSVNTTINGTGTLLSAINFYINQNLVRTFEYNSTNTANCSYITYESEVMNCVFDYNITTQDGNYTLAVYAQDFGGESGNNQTKRVNMILDTIAPNVTMVSYPENGWINSTSYNFTFILNDESSTVLDYDFWVVNSTFDDIQPTIINTTTRGELASVIADLTSAIEDDNLTWFLFVMDQAGNSYQINSSFQIETRKPQSEITGNNSNWVNTPYNVTITAQDSHSGISKIFYQIGNREPLSFNNDNITVTINDSGEYNVTFWSQDFAGNLEDKQKFIVKLDTENPTTVISGNSSLWQNNDFTVTFNGIDYLSGINFTEYNSGSGWTQVIGNNLTITQEGEYNISFRSHDLTGNIENNKTFLVKLDKTEPVLNITSPSNSTHQSSNLTFTYNTSDSISGVNTSTCMYTINGSWNQCNNYIDNLEDGTHTLTVNISDNANNTKTQSITFTVNEAPKSELIKVRLPLEYNESNNYWFNITLSDNSGVDNAILYLNGSFYDMTNRGSGLWTYNRTNLSNGVYTYYFSANDTSNNIWTSQNSTFTVRSLDSNETTINQSNFTAPANATNLIVDELHNVTIPKESESTVTLDLSNQIADGKITLSNPVILKRETNTENYTIEIPLGTKLSSNDSWDGKLIIPEIRTNMQVPQDTQGTVDLALKMGSDDYEISFDKAVKIILPGNAGKSAGWTRGNNTLIPITTTCDSTTNPTNIDPVNTRICKVDDGNDLLIFTYHFTTFAAYTQTSPSGGGGSSKTSSITKSYTIGEIEKNEIINKELEENQQIKFNLDSEQHSLELNRIDYTNKQITIIIRSEPITLKLNEYEFKTVDVDKDGKDDLKVWFEFESSRKANIFVERIEESNTFKQEEVESKQNDDTNNVEIIKQENNNLQIEDKTSNDNQIEKVDNSKINEKTEEQSGNSQLLIGLFVILLLFIIISIVIFNYSKKEEMLKKNKIKKN